MKILKLLLSIAFMFHESYALVVLKYASPDQIGVQSDPIERVKGHVLPPPIPASGGQVGGIIGNDRFI